MDRDLAIARQRLTSLLEGTRHGSPQEAVRWLVAVQAQEYRISLWSIAQRLVDADETALMAAVDDGRLLRTHVLRPTWHLVAAQDLRMLLAATAPQLQARNEPRYRQLELDHRTRGRCRELIGEALRGGVHLTRQQVGEGLRAAGIDARGPRLAHIMMDAELEAVVCSGAQQGRWQTYALVDERTPAARPLDTEEATVELVRRYLASHGPATEKDLRSWATLRVSDLRPALEELHGELVPEEHDGRTYWSVRGRPEPHAPSPPRARLLQPYDEYIMGYLDSRHVIDVAARGASLHPDAVIPNNVVLIDTQLAGHWKRTTRGDTVIIDAYLYDRPDADVEAAIDAAAADHGRFLGLDAELVVNDHISVSRRFD